MRQLLIQQFKLCEEMPIPQTCCSAKIWHCGATKTLRCQLTRIPSRVAPAHFNLISSVLVPLCRIKITEFIYLFIHVFVLLISINYGFVHLIKIWTFVLKSWITALTLWAWVLLYQKNPHIYRMVPDASP